MIASVDGAPQGDELWISVPQGVELRTRGATRRSARIVRRRGRFNAARRAASIALPALLASTLPTANAQSCISLSGSTTCSAFGSSSISTDTSLAGLFPFLSTVTDLASFDAGLKTYISGDYALVKYKTLLGCSDFRSDNTTDFYARYTTSVLCNAIVQNSIAPCGLSGTATRPLCAESCADFAQSEEDITASNICGTAGSGALTEIRADFTNCALPADSLTQSCILAVANQPDNCGYASNLSGLCSYCAASSPNSTDSCCVFADATTRCTGVSLPIVASSSLKPIKMSMTKHAASSTSSASHSATSAASSHPGLTGGQVAGVVIGALLGALALLGIIIFCCVFVKRRRDRSPASSVFNQPTPSRHHQPPMAFHDGARDRERAGLAILPGARVARMDALESPRRSDAYGRTRPKSTNNDDSPQSSELARPSGRLRDLEGSLSSGSQFAANATAAAAAAAAAAAGAAGDATDTSPSSNADYTSPESGGQSEQLAFFKDYYSQDEIHTGDIVSTLWTYEPRAADEFALERGDMIKVLGIWDDGWATGVRVRRKADDWRPAVKLQRDSGLSGSGNDDSSPPSPEDEGEGEVKAFPLVCVCLPQHWRRTIEGESTEGSAPAALSDTQ